jgi:hypothetical protein
MDKEIVNLWDLQVAIREEMVKNKELLNRVCKICVE